jgi:hypothetical protein
MNTVVLLYSFYVYRGNKYNYCELNYKGIKKII